MGTKNRLKWLTRDMVNHEVTPDAPGLPKMLRNMGIKTRTLLRAMVRREAQYDMGTKWTEITQKLMNMREGRNPTHRRYHGPRTRDARRTLFKNMQPKPQLMVESTVPEAANEAT